MKKRIIIFAMVAVIAMSVVFTACNKDVYTDPSTGEKYILVTDENGEKVLNDDGELLVYVTDEDGKKVKDADGNYETEVHGFVGQVENDGVVEDYAYYFTLPDGWETVSDRGEFMNEKTASELEIQILEETMDDCIAKIERTYNALNDYKDKLETDFIVLKNEYDNEKIAGKVYAITLKHAGEVRVTVAFQNNGNTYQLDFSTTRDITVEEAEKETIDFINSIEFKPYTYYPDLTNKAE